MLYLLCITYDGFVRMKDFDTCDERETYMQSLDRSEFRTVIQVDGCIYFHD